MAQFNNNFIIICSSYEQAQTMNSALQPLTFHARLRALTVDNHNALITDQITWRVPVKGGAVPDWKFIVDDARINAAGLVLILSPSDTPDMIRPMLRDFLYKRAKQAVRTFRALKGMFQPEDRFDPPMDFELHCKGPLVWARLIDPRDDRKLSSFGVNLYKPDYLQIAGYRELARLQNELTANYPFLHFLAMRTFKGDAVEVAVWICDNREIDGRRVRMSGAATGLTFRPPLSPVVRTRLIRLNEAAREASQPGMFFCSECQKAKPKSEYAGFLFANVRCNECADPDWRKRAREENYN